MAAAGGEVVEFGWEDAETKKPLSGRRAKVLKEQKKKNKSGTFGEQLLDAQLTVLCCYALWHGSSIRLQHQQQPVHVTALEVNSLQQQYQQPLLPARRSLQQLRAGQTCILGAAVHAVLGYPAGALAVFVKPAAAASRRVWHLLCASQQQDMTTQLWTAIEGAEQSTILCLQSHCAVPHDMPPLA